MGGARGWCQRALPDLLPSRTRTGRAERASPTHACSPPHLPPCCAALESAHTNLQQRLNEAVLELDAARVAKGQAEVDWEVARNELQQRAAEAERRAKALGEQRDVLQQQLEKAAAEAPGEGERGL